MQAEFTNLFSDNNTNSNTGGMPIMLNTFSCSNYRNINVNNLSFSRVNLLVGPNNSGKSNFIKALTFFSDLLKNPQEGSLRLAFLNAVSRDNWEHSRNNNVDKFTPIRMKWGIELGNKKLDYAFDYTVGSDVSDCKIVRESLSESRPTGPQYINSFNYFNCHKSELGKGMFSTAFVPGKQNKRVSFNVNPSETLIMQYKSMLLDNASMYKSDLLRKDLAALLADLESYFKSYDVYSASHFNSASMREPADVRNLDLTLSKSASNLVNVFNNLTVEDPICRLSFIKYFKQLIHELDDISVNVMYNHLIMRLVYNNHSYDLADVSDGTLKALALNMIINMKKGQRTLLALDEPETNLHPAWQKVVGEWILNSDSYDQCFISTHSPDFLDTFTDGFRQGDVSVFTFDLPGIDGNCKIRRIDAAKVLNSLGDWELGDLYRVGDIALGGWPW